MKELKPAIGSAYQRKVMLLAKRSEKSNPSLLKVSKLYAVKHIFSEGVVGIGLPILIEYFWQRGLSDFFIKTKIFFSRLWAFGRLLKQSDVYEITLSNDPKVNAEFLINWCKR